VAQPLVYAPFTPSDSPKHQMVDRIESGYRFRLPMLLAFARERFVSHRASRTKTAAVTAPFAVARKTRPAAEQGDAIMLRTLKCPVIALEEHLLG
jgi:hypothetical protein